MYFSGDCRDLAHGHLMDSDDRGMHSGGVPHRRSSRGVLSGASVGSFWSVATVVLVAIAVCLLIGIWYVGDEGLSADRDKGSYGGSKVWYLPLTHPTVSYETLHATVYAFSLFVRSVLFLTTLSDFSHQVQAAEKDVPRFGGTVQAATAGGASGPHNSAPPTQGQAQLKRERERGGDRERERRR